MLSAPSVAAASTLRLPTPPSFCLGSDSSVLTTVNDPAVNLVRWQRSLPMALGSWLAKHVQAAPRTPVALRALSPDLDQLVGDLPPGVLRTALVTDVSLLLGHLLAISGAPVVHGSFGLVTGDSCVKFHTDYVALRLLCTYVGPGTEWLPEDSVCRPCLGEATPAGAEANAHIVKAGHRTKQADTGDVLLLKGDSWPGNANRGAVHRSPSLGPGNPPRVVLTLTVWRLP